MHNWWTLIKERFSPGAYGPMIILFTLANALYLSNTTSASVSGPRIVLAVLLMLSFFFRMRLFDEIKDYEVDLKINPTRPLARGILSVSQVKLALLFLIVFELVLAAILGMNCFLIHAVAMGYSLLMYEEFFIGDALRPHLTSYAITHTFVSVLLGISSAVAITGASPFELSGSMCFFFLTNWGFFNLFEFARKTFAKEEERPQVASYSNIFGITGAWALSVSQAIVGVAVISYYQVSNLLFIALGLYVLATLPFLILKTVGAAKLFRNVSASYLLTHYALLIYVFWGA